MQEYINLLGTTAIDKITGITGTVTSISFDLYGCVQAIVKQKVQEDGKVPAAQWYDVARLDVVDRNPVMAIPNFGRLNKTELSGPEAKPIQ